MPTNSSKTQTTTPIPSEPVSTPTPTSTPEPTPTQNPVDATTTQATPTTPVQTITPEPAPTTQTRTFNAAELAKFNGLNDQPSYLAIDGVVYDVSSKFKNGSHHGCYAGRDVTTTFFAKHVKAILKNYPVMGNYIS